MSEINVGGIGMNCRARRVNDWLFGSASVRYAYRFCLQDADVAMNRSF